MTEQQTLEVIPVETLVGRARAMREAGCRLVQIGATMLPEQLELNYSFDRDGAMTTLRLVLPPEGARVPSISGEFWCAFIYENEIHDLFKVTVDGMAIDFGGKFYNTSVKFAFGARKIPAAQAKSSTAKPVASPAPATQGAAPSSTASLSA